MKRKPTDEEIVEEAARRGMSVMDAAEAARLRGVAEGVEKLADEWEAEARRHTDLYMELRDSGQGYSVQLRHARLCHNHAVALRALLHVDIESEAGE